MGNGEWKVYFSKSVWDIYNKLKSDTENILAKDAQNSAHPKVRDFIKLQKGIADVIADPENKIYRLGKTLGKKHTN